ncbi:hypothetical protein ABEB36_010439 [Hypothenemus hampei]|uniref:Uncharacterized protein n=1 Tax=Hypothenemus hampei TaxID=57062 RepID=A0ABD1EMP0_HYPHA
MSNSEDENDDRQLNIAILGELNVGKTNLIKKFTQNEFSTVYVPTIGADFYVKRINLGRREIIIRITDISGMELRGHMLNTYLFKSNIVILVYDITNMESFNALINWSNSMAELITNDIETNKFYTVFMGNKCDLVYKRTGLRLDMERSVLINDTMKFSRYFVSGKTGENVYESFMEIVTKYLNIPLLNVDVNKNEKQLRKTGLMMQQRMSQDCQTYGQKSMASNEKKENPILRSTCNLQ